MRHDPTTASAPGGNVRIYTRPSRWSTLAPLFWILLAGLILLIVFVLLVRQR